MSQKDGKMVQITKDHKPEDEEKERIEKMGGFVSNLSVPRVNGLLAISRSLGNADLISKGKNKNTFILFLISPLSYFS